MGFLQGEKVTAYLGIREREGQMTNQDSALKTNTPWAARDVPQALLDHMRRAWFLQLPTLHESCVSLAECLGFSEFTFQPMCEERNERRSAYSVNSLSPTAGSFESPMGSVPFPTWGVLFFTLLL